jgi:hypothetical protein
MGITFKAFSECVDFVTAVKKPVLLRARHGVGKSSCVYAYAEYKGLPVIERRASQMTEGDLLGLPKLENGKTEWIPPAWLKDASDTPVVLFIDEIDRATPEVRQGFFELCDSRKIAGCRLHSDTLIFAAVNGGEHGAQYQVGEMDPAELDRWTVFDLEPDTSDWLNWARRDNNINSFVCDFISESPKHLEHEGDFEPNKVYPSRRSWHRFSECCDNAELIQPGEASGILFNIAQGFLGLEAAVAFQDYVRTVKRQVSVKDILEGKYALTEKYDINEHNALIEKFETYIAKLSTPPTDAELENLAHYFVSLPGECAMSMLEKILGTAKNSDGAVNVSLIKRFYSINEGMVNVYVTKILKAGVLNDKEENEEEVK